MGAKEIDWTEKNAEIGRQINDMIEVLEVYQDRILKQQTVKKNPNLTNCIRITAQAIEALDDLPSYMKIVG